jgi:hypothetical protein
VLGSLEFCVCLVTCVGACGQGVVCGVRLSCALGSGDGECASAREVACLSAFMMIGWFCFI